MLIKLVWGNLIARIGVGKVPKQVYFVELATILWACMMPNILINLTQFL